MADWRSLMGLTATGAPPPGRGSQQFTGGSFDPNDPGILRKFLFGLTDLPHQASQGRFVEPGGETLGYALNFAGGAPTGLATGNPFYSALARAVEDAPVTKAPGQQWMGTLNKMPGVKPEELQWTGFQDWLNAKQGSVTKQEATDYLNQNQVQLGEVMKGQPTGNSVSPNGAVFTPDELADPIARRAAERVGLAPEVSPTKFSQYQLPGGENYREMLLTLPHKEDLAAGNRVAGYAKHLREKYGERYSTIASPEELAHYEKLHEDLYQASKGPPEFKSSHYDEPNVLAHTRFNDRTTADGKKTLFLEEVQSDWHQKGRKQGYQSEHSPPNSELEARWGQITLEKEKLAADRDPVTNVMVNERRWHDLSSEAAQIQRTLRSRDSAVPDAPFKKDWHELALKRMVKHAVDNGYDSVSWTPGKVQAERYDLSKQVDAIKAYKRGDGGFEVSVRKKGDTLYTDIPGGYNVPADKLPNLIGKELADKIVKQESQENIYSGLDLQVGGEGMKAFYDKMLPAAANKLGKKYGAKVGVTRMKVGNAPDDVVDYWAAREPDHPMVKQARQEVWTLPITDAMRKEVGEKGMPLFTAGGIGAPWVFPQGGPQTQSPAPTKVGKDWFMGRIS